ncbi:hypothetical protein P154DRAFT_436678 [Amniculicola lignicola CBS 123094]|uniref:DNA-directed RNA polymerase III subunit n=1 Tax=Amniculicola lignicola CBS 123094 TaxID=1392246 RepID=A0A6A5WQ24_9PLEO|nr:hypothetical protein P154DRAFT_436678 [Amniculicola lignicola CBS 123094]
MSGRGRGGGRGGFGGGGRGGLKIGGVELNWDLSGIQVDKKPAERFPKRAAPLPPPPTSTEKRSVQYYMQIRDRIHSGPFYTVLNDGMRNGLRRPNNEPAPTEEQLFNPFTDNETYSAKYNKVRRRIPKLDTRPYVKELFPAELRALLGDDSDDADDADGARPAKKRKLLSVKKVGNAMTRIDAYLAEEEDRLKHHPNGANPDNPDDVDPDDDDDEEENGEEDEEDEEDVDDNFSAVSSDSEDSDDDYNAEQYFDNGEDDEGDEGDPYENTYE